MTGIWGADISQLEQLAAQFEQASVQIEGIRSRTTLLLGSINWHGGDFQRFLAEWQQRDAPALGSAAQALALASTTLSQAAQKQEVASEASFSLTDLLGGLKKLWTEIGVAAAYAAGPGLVQIMAEATQPAAAQLAWWNSLTPAQQSALLALEPGALLQLSGLPANVRADANQSMAESYLSTIAVDTKKSDIQGGASIKIVSLGGDLSMTETTYADGHSTVTLDGNGTAGVGIGIPEAGVGINVNGDVSRTYTFSSAAQAQQFESGLENAAVPHLTVSPWDLLAITGGPLGVAGAVGASTLSNTESNISNFLGGYNSNVTSTTIGGSLNGTANLTMPGVEGMGDQGGIQVSGGIGVQHDLDSRTTTGFVDLSGNAQASFGPFDGAASANGQVAVTWGSDGKIQNLAVQGSYSAVGGVNPAEFPIENMSGRGGTYQMNVDLTNPTNQALAVQLLQDTNSGDAAGAAQALAALKNNSEIVVQTDANSSSGGGFNFGVVSGGATNTNQSATSTWIKPPDGTFTQVHS